MEKLRIVYMGTPDFAVPSLEKLIADGHEILCVYTQPDKPKGRGMQLAAPPVKECAVSHGIPVHQPTKLKNGKVAAEISEMKPDMIVVVAYGRILPHDILEIPKFGCINLHGSLLPKYRGAAPIQWAVLNGDEYSGCSTMFLSDGMDEGDVIEQTVTKIGDNETSGELFDRLSCLGADLLSHTVSIVAEGNCSATAQDPSLATYTTMLDKSMCPLDFAGSAASVHNQIRGLNPWPVAVTTIAGKKVKIHESRIAEGTGIPGEVLENGKKFVVACKSGAIEIVSLQAEGGKRMSGSDYLRGHPIEKGTVIG